MLQVGTLLPGRSQSSPFCLTTGQTSYSSDSYYDDYNEEEYDDEGEDGHDLEQENWEEMGRMAKMNTTGETFTVDAGTTIRLPCHIDDLHGTTLLYIACKQKVFPCFSRCGL